MMSVMSPRASSAIAPCLAGGLVVAEARHAAIEEVERPKYENTEDPVYEVSLSVTN